MRRSATIHRQTQETDIRIELELDGTGQSIIETGIGFLDHMLTQLAKHGLFDLTINGRGDLHVDGHHTVEDSAIALGQAFRQALGERRGLRRFGAAHVPLDEALVRVVVDLSNRPHLSWQVPFTTPRLGALDTELIHEWFVAFATRASITLHVTALAGSNNHHIAEACFKSLALALREACSRDPRRDESSVPSSKGTLSL